MAIAPWSAAYSGIDGVRRQLRFNVSLVNPSADELKDQTLWLYMPAAETATQRLENLQVSMEHKLSVDVLGQSVVELAFPNFAPLATKVVTVIAEVSLRSAPEITPLSNPAHWLRSERHVEADDPHVVALAAQLERATPLDTARAIYDWVRQNLRYAGYVADDLGALHALTQYSGDCTEYAYLAVALSRASGIPARMLGGFVTDRNVAPRAEDYHNWAEVHVGGTWRLLDAQKENWLTPAERYVAFRVSSGEVVNRIGLAHRFRMAGMLQARL